MRASSTNMETSSGPRPCRQDLLDGEDALEPLGPERLAANTSAIRPRRSVQQQVLSELDGLSMEARNERILAIKKILPTNGRDPELVHVRRRGAHRGQLSHPNIVRSSSWASTTRTLYIAMEYISGRDLRHCSTVPRRGNRCPSRRPAPSPRRCAKRSTMRTASGTPRATRSGSSTADVSPANVLVSFDAG